MGLSQESIPWFGYVQSADSAKSRSVLPEVLAISKTACLNTIKYQIEAEGASTAAREEFAYTPLVSSMILSVLLELVN